MSILPEEIIRASSWNNNLKTNKLPFNQLIMQEILDKYNNRDFVLEFNQSEEKVEKLLSDYRLYKSINWIINLMKLDSEKPEISSEIELLNARLKDIWDNMKYDNPYIWIKYKLLAYQNDEQNSINTLWDLIKHCSPEWYICWKRLDFLNKFLISKYNLNIYDLDPNTLLVDFLNNEEIINLCKDSQFMINWTWYEYYTVWNKTEKWWNYNIWKSRNWK